MKQLLKEAYMLTILALGGSVMGGGLWLIFMGIAYAPLLIPVGLFLTYAGSIPVAWTLHQ